MREAFITVDQPPLNLVVNMRHPNGFINHRIANAKVLGIAKIIRADTSLGYEYFLSNNIERPEGKPHFLVYVTSVAQCMHAFLTDGHWFWYVTGYELNDLCTRPSSFRVVDCYWAIDQSDIDKMLEAIKRYVEGLE